MTRALPTLVLLALAGCAGPAPCDLVVFADADGDGYGDETVEKTACEVPEGWTQVPGDCDDQRPWMNPGATDGFCDDQDMDCDGVGGDEAATILATPYPSIQAAIDAAAPGDTVLVCPVVHQERLTIRAGQDVILESLSLRKRPTLDGRGEGTLVEVEPGATAVLRRLDLVFAGDSALRATDADVELVDCLLEANDGQDGGGVDFRTTGAGGRLRLTGSTLARNHAEGAGGAVYLDLGGGASFVEVVGSVFTDNRADELGGALALTGSTGGYLALARGGLFDNVSAGDGGALCVSGGPSAAMDVDLEDLELYGNAAARGGAVAVVADGGVVSSLVEVVFLQNQATDEGGAVWFAPQGDEGQLRVSGAWSGVRADLNAAARGGALALRSGWHTLDQASFTGNQAWEAGGALLFGDQGDPQSVARLDEVGFDGNTAPRGAAVELVAGHFDLDRATLYRNSPVDGGDTRAAAMTVGYLEDIDLAVTDSDWGTGGADNEPRDLYAPGSTWDDLGPSVSFTCAPGGCER